MHAVKRFMGKMWSFVQMLEMFYNEEGYFILKLKTNEERDEVMMKGPYTIQNLPMVILAWRPDFSMAKDMMHTVPIWVTLPQLLLHMCGERSLGKIDSVIGNPLYIDECTIKKIRVTYACILVEVDVTQKLCKEIVINDYEGNKRQQRVEYEWRPKFCEQCQKMGHVCNAKKPPLKVWMPKKVSQEKEDELEQLGEIVQGKKVEPALENCEDEKQQEEPEGLWTSVTKGSRRKGMPTIIDDSLKHIFSQNGFSTLGDWNGPKVNPFIDK